MRVTLALTLSACIASGPATGMLSGNVRTDPRGGEVTSAETTGGLLRLSAKSYAKN